MNRRSLAAVLLAACPWSFGHAYTINGSTVTLEASDQTADNTVLIQTLLNEPAFSQIVLSPGSGNASWKVRPLFVTHDNTKIHLLANAVLEAKAGGFPNADDCLISAIGRSGITVSGEPGSAFRMPLEEYAALAKSEWRHALNFLGCSQVLVENLTILRPGGDGIYLGSIPGNLASYCSSVTIRSVIVDGAARNGLSVISIDGLQVANCTFQRSDGLNQVATDGPWAGIDFEPNEPVQRLKNIVVENCAFLANAGFGFLLAAGKLKGSTEAIDLIVRNCLMQGSPYLARARLTGQGIHISGIPASLGANSRILFSGCTIADNQQCGIHVESKSHAAGLLAFADCYLRNNNTVSGYIPIYVTAENEPSGNIQFNNVVIEQSGDLFPADLSYCLMINGEHVASSDFTGRVYRSVGALNAVNATNVNISLASNAPASWWKLDETSGADATDSTGTRTATLRSNPARTVGRVGGGLRLDGNGQYVEVTQNSSDLNIGTGDFSIALWFQRSDDPIANKRLLYKGASSETDPGYAIAGSNTTLEFLLSDGTTRVSAAGTIPALNQWNHVACTLSRSGKMALYINGVLQRAVDIGAMAGTNIANSLHLMIGSAQGGFLSWPGMVDDVRVYQRALPSGEVAALALAPSAHWRLGETSGTTAADSAGRSKGTLQNKPFWTTGRMGGALQLNGTDQYVEITDNASDLNIGKGDFSIALWFQRFKNATANRRLLYKGASSNSETGYAIAGSDKTLEFLLSNGSSRVSVAGSLPTLSQWNHLACTLSRSGNMTLYLNGVPQQSVDISALSGDDISNTASLLLGSAPGGNLAWSGRLDDVRIYKRALSAQEITRLAGEAAVRTHEPPEPPPQLISAVSRKTHGPAGAFDLPLPLEDPSGIESRTGNACTLVFTFDKPLLDGSAALAAGTAQVDGPFFSGETMTVHLSNVSDQQKIILDLIDVRSGEDGDRFVGQLSFRLLAGDANASGGINSADTLAVQRKLGRRTAPAVVREDVNGSGGVSSADILIIQKNLGHSVAP